MPYVGGVHNYHRRLNEVIANGFEGLIMSGGVESAQPLAEAGDD